MLHLDHATHTYTVGGKKFKQSVTGIVNRFCPEFQKEIIAEAVAKKEGKQAQEVIDEWDLNANISTDFGHAIHKAIEYHIRYGKSPKHPYIADVVEKWTAIAPTRTQIRAEMAVYSEELGVSGTMDVLEITGQKRAKIHDIKTNADLQKKASKMKAPFDDLQATPYNKYRLQLSIYKHLMELLGWEIEGLYLWHWTTDWEKIELQELEIKQWTKILFQA